jgi:lactate dehydrogenase-like 2-hydroxyacid dehydrogenase
MIKIAVTETEFDKAEAVFRGCTDIECLRAPSDEDGLAEFIRKTEAWGVIVGVDKYSGTLYEVLPAGGVIARFGVGHDGIDKNMAAATGIYCINTPGVLDTSVAECAAGLILCTARRFGENIANTRGNTETGRGLNYTEKHLR